MLVNGTKMTFISEETDCQMWDGETLMVHQGVTCGVGIALILTGQEVSIMS